MHGSRHKATCCDSMRVVLLRAKGVVWCGMLTLKVREEEK